MPDPDRLPQLLRQRELAREQLAWLDREIAAASGGTETPAPPAAPPPVPVATPAPAVAPQSAASVPVPPAAPSYVTGQATALLSRSTAAAAPVTDDEPLPAADQILEQYRVAPDAMKTDVRKGCLLYFFAALAFVALGVAVLFLLFQRGR